MHNSVLKKKLTNHVGHCTFRRSTSYIPKMITRWLPKLQSGSGFRYSPLFVLLFDNRWQHHIRVGGAHVIYLESAESLVCCCTAPLNSARVEILFFYISHNTFLDIQNHRTNVTIDKRCSKNLNNKNFKIRKNF